MAETGIDKAIAALNQRLKDAAISPRVKRNGAKLILRATIPNRSGLGRKRHELSLGIPASKDGLRVIESKAHDLAKQLMLGTFSWEDWERSRSPKPDELPVSQLVEQFKSFYLIEHRMKESTWIDQWQRTYNRLPPNEPLTETLILAAILVTNPHSETRNRTCQRLQALADYAGLKVDLANHRGDYGAKSLKPRDLPNDNLIMEWRDRVPNPAWQWVYGIIATFGLRPHEVFACEFIDRYTVRVFDTIETRSGTDKTKTGHHIARAFPPEWSEQWNLIKVNRPNVTAGKTSDYGNRNKRQFQRYEIPFPAYNLRHAYALRGSLQYDMDTAEMARMMGHSELVHVRTYRRWLDEVEVQRNYDRLVLKKQPS